MKCVVFIACLACFSSFFSTKASAHLPAAPIPLKGEIPPPQGPKSPSTSLIEAYQNATSVDLVFNCDLGVLTIEVVDQTGETVYLKKLNAVANGTLSIDTCGWASGEYILMITDGQGGYLEGSFLTD